MKKTTTPDVNVARIAEVCGVSAMTVSRALRSDAAIAAKTREKILTAAEEMGYRLPTRRGRPRGATAKVRPAVEVLLGTEIAPESLYSARLLISIEQELGIRHHDCVIRTCSGDYKQFISLCDAMRQGKSAGTLVVGHFAIDQLQTILELAPDAILVDNEGDPRLARPCESISYDNAETARIAVRHLVGLGRQRILLLRGPADHYFSRSVLQGYRDVYAALGLQVDEQLVQECDYSSRDACDIVTRLLADDLAFDAVFANDEMAFGVLRALTQAGRRVPQDVAIVGCDGLPMGEVTMPSLTTISLDAARLGQLAVDRIFSREKDAEPEYRLQLLPRLIVRESTARPGASS